MPVSSFNFNVAVGTDINTNVGFNPLGVVVSNFTPYYIYFADALSYCPPWTSGVVLPMAHATQARATWAQSPFGPQVISAPPTGIKYTASITFSEDPNLVLAGGTLVTPPIATSSTVFPLSPILYDRYFRTDIGMEFFWDGLRWVSSTLYIAQAESVVGITDIISVTTSPTHIWAPPYSNVYDLWIVHAEVNFSVSGGTALDPLNSWIGTFARLNSGIIIATYIINSGSSAAFRNIKQAVGALMGLTQYFARLGWTKTGTPGPLTSHLTIAYRIVAT